MERRLNKKIKKLREEVAILKGEHEEIDKDQGTEKDMGLKNKWWLVIKLALIGIIGAILLSVFVVLLRRVDSTNGAVIGGALVGGAIG